MVHAARLPGAWCCDAIAALGWGSLQLECRPTADCLTMQRQQYRRLDFGVGCGRQTGHRSAAFSSIALPSQADAERLGQHETPSLFTDFCPATQHHEEPMYITDSDDIDSEAKHDYDIGADLGGASLAHI